MTGACGFAVLVLAGPGHLRATARSPPIGTSLRRLCEWARPVGCGTFKNEETVAALPSSRQMRGPAELPLEKP